MAMKKITESRTRPKTFNYYRNYLLLALSFKLLETQKKRDTNEKFDDEEPVVKGRMISVSLIHV